MGSRIGRLIVLLRVEPAGDVLPDVLCCGRGDRLAWRRTGQQQQSGSLSGKHDCRPPRIFNFISPRRCYLNLLSPFRTAHYFLWLRRRLCRAWAIDRFSHPVQSVWAPSRRQAPLIVL